jgi:uncharacterized repeat protein (TIGR01451 family)
MGRHAAPPARRTARWTAAAGSTALLAGTVVALTTPAAEAMPPNPLTVTVTASSSSVTPGDFVQFTVKVTNTSTKPTVEPSYTLTNSVTNGTAQPPYLQQTSGPDHWTCSATTQQCDLYTTIAAGASDTFQVLVKAGSAAGGVTDKATVFLWDGDADDRTSTPDPDTPTSTGSATASTTAGGSGGGSTITVTGFCPNTGCTVSSSPSQPTATNPTVAAVTFPAYSGPGFTYTYTLETQRNFCGLNTCTGAAANLGNLADTSKYPQFTDPSNPTKVSLIYDTTITQGASQGQGTTTAWKSTDGTAGSGALLAPCATTGGNTPCSQLAFRDGNGDLDTLVDLVSSDPWIGNYYIA